ncbi:MAG: hypothetical protein LBC19_09330 [Tannerella sp.]|jgi:hypothetical protein|nr:hypothetical protein [Tannerella sp.]
MEEFGDWLYLIIIIIAGISSLIGTINKKSKETAERRQPREIITEDAEEWTDWKNEDARYDDTEIPQPVFAEKQPANSLRRAVVTPDLHARQNVFSNYGHSFKTQDNDYSTFEKRTGHAAPSDFYTEDDDNTSITFEDLPANTEEWRKAFVYNEIFKRKY